MIPNHQTSAIGEELDELGVEADAVEGGELDVHVSEAEPSGGERVGLGEAGEDGEVHELLLERDQQRDLRHHYSPDAVHQHAQVRNHFSAAVRRRQWPLPSGIGSPDGPGGEGGCPARSPLWSPPPPQPPPWSLPAEETGGGRGRGEVEEEGGDGHAEVDEQETLQAEDEAAGGRRGARALPASTPPASWGSWLGLANATFHPFILKKISF